MKHKRYHISGQFKQTARVHPRRQLEQHDECRSVRPESEQCADEYQYQHWVPRRQELWLQHLVYKVRPCKKGWLEWPLTKVSAREQTKDLPFGLSVPDSFMLIWLNRIVPGGIPVLTGFRPGWTCLMDKLIVFRRCYEYLFWLRPTVERFARVHKHSLGAEMHNCGLNMLKLVVRANYSDVRAELIQEAIVEYEVQRVYLRLSYEYKLLNKRQFDFASCKLEEIARLLRAWQKKYN